MAAHAWWRVWISAAQAGGWPGMAALYLRTAPGGAQAAVGGVAIESGHYSNWEVSRLFDGDDGADWSHGSNAPAWVGYHFPAPVDIVEFAITSRVSDNYADAPVNGFLQWSDDGATWTSAYSYSFDAWTANLQTKTATLVELPVGKHRYVRLKIDSWGDGGRIARSRTKSNSSGRPTKT